MKTVLLAVCGLSPQVVTETLYALHQQGQNVDAIRVLTTRTGQEAAVAHLFGACDGAFYRYLEDYKLSPGAIDFSPRHVKAVTNAHGKALKDIYDDDDSELFLKACLDIAFELCQEPGRVYFSIAGGRKTMGACLTLAAQFYARRQDRICHVLVSPEFEGNRDFFYPPPKPRPIQLTDFRGEPMSKSSRYARVQLVIMPFITVRERFTDERLKLPEPPGALLMDLVREEKSELFIDLTKFHVCYRGVELDLPPAQLALYAFFARRKKEYPCDMPSCTGCDEHCQLDVTGIFAAQAEIDRLYRSLAGNKEVAAMSDSGIRNLSAENFNSYKSKINRSLEGRFGPYEARSLKIEGRGSRPETRYGISLDRGRIRLIQ